MAATCAMLRQTAGVPGNAWKAYRHMSRGAPTLEGAGSPACPACRGWQWPAAGWFAAGVAVITALTVFLSPIGASAFSPLETGSVKGCRDRGRDVAGDG
jgi:hypothetical protein